MCSFASPVHSKRKISILHSSFLDYFLAGVLAWQAHCDHINPGSNCTQTHLKSGLVFTLWFLYILNNKDSIIKVLRKAMEMQRMLNTKPMAPDTPHPSLSAPSHLFLPAIPTLNCGPSRSYSHKVNYAKHFCE